MSHSSTTSYEEHRENIRTLTSLLHSFKLQKPPSKQPRDILPFLNHFTTLLTCGDPYDNQAEKVTAVTGSIDSFNRVKTLVVAQNLHKGLQAEGVNIELIEKDARSLDEVIQGPPNLSLDRHIADVWIALSEFSTLNPSMPEYQDRIESLEIFFFSRSFRKFATRFKEDCNLCGGKRLYEVIREWRPNRAEIAAKWVSRRGWLVDFQDVRSMTSRDTGQEIQWEFSDKTKVAWSEILAIILQQMDVGISRVKHSEDGSTHERRQAMEDLNNWCRALYYFVFWDEGIVKSLLTETSMVSSIATTFMPTTGNISPNTKTGDELRQEPDESKGQQVFRYLKTVVAWHAAVHCLPKDKTLPELLKNLEVGLVGTPVSSSSILTPPQTFTDTLFARFPNLEKSREDVVKALDKHYPSTFTGCIHAKAMLMGLVNYFAHEPTYANQCALIKNGENMRRIIQPVADAGNVVIAAGKKCCWCCDWLGPKLETQFKLSGTHGIMYAWDPPIVGVSESVLKNLEDELWGELHNAVLTVIESSYSRHSSGASSPEGVTIDEWFSFRVKRRSEH